MFLNEDDHKSASARDPAVFFCYSESIYELAVLEVSKRAHKYLRQKEYQLLTFISLFLLSMNFEELKSEELVGNVAKVLEELVQKVRLFAISEQKIFLLLLSRN